MWFKRSKTPSSSAQTALPPLPTQTGPVIVPARVIQLSAAKVAELIMLASMKSSSSDDDQNPSGVPLPLPVAAYAATNEHSIAADPNDEIAEMIASSNSGGQSILSNVPPALRRAMAARTTQQREASHAELMALLEAEVVDEQIQTERPFTDSMAALRAVDSGHWNKSFWGRARTARVWIRIYGPKIGALLFLTTLLAGVVSVGDKKLKFVKT
jgi:hypothetical protein